MINQVTMIPVKKIYPHPDNPRKTIGDVTELADSIKRNGVLQNLTVIEGHYTKDGFAEGAYTAVIGHRRLAAARQAGLEEVPCVIKEMDRKEQVQTMLLENIQRADLTVYEQAQGFQMMLDLGYTIEDISQKTGFSETTVRRRVKMMELDQKVLKKVSERQLSLTDFDRLAQIRDINDRNAVLEKIGTNDFNQSVSGALRRQASADNLPEVKKWLSARKAKEISSNESWSNKYERIANITLSELGQPGETLPIVAEGEALFYVLDSYYVRIYKKTKKAPAVKRSAEEIAKEKEEKQAGEDYARLTKELYGLRKAFADSFYPSAGNIGTVHLIAFRAALVKDMAYHSSDRETIKKVFGIDIHGYISDTDSIVYKGIATLSPSDEWKCAYALFGDQNGNNFNSRSDSRFPEYKDNPLLRLQYDSLALLGYEISTEEQAFIDGTHELYHRGEKYA